MRTIQVRLWVLVAALLLGVSIGATAIAFATRNRPEARLAAKDVLSPEPTTTTTVEVLPSTSTSTSTVTSTTRPAAQASSTTRPPPRGSLQVLGASAGGGFGQSPAHSSCSNWQLRFINNSNTEIVRITFAPPAGDFSNFREFNRQTQQHAPDIPAEKPVPTVISVSLPPYGGQSLRFQTCTVTPPPENTNYEYSVTAPDTVDFTWVTGHSATAPFSG
jgi:hypothetical protein